MQKKLFFLVFIVFSSCRPQMAVETVAGLELDNLNGRIRTITSSVYYPVQDGIAGSIMKEDSRDIDKKTYSGDGNVIKTVTA